MDYVHCNPVKRDLVSAPADWPYSTFKTGVHRGWHPRIGSAAVSGTCKPAKHEIHAG